MARKFLDGIDVVGLMTAESGASVGNNAAVGTVPLTVTQSVAASGAVGVIAITSAASTGQTASAEINAANFNFSATRTWAAGAITTQREFLIQAPTYAFTSTPSTITEAATFAITGAPIAGSNATLTNTYAFWVQAGLAQFDGGITSTAGTSTFGTVTAVGFTATKGVFAGNASGPTTTIPLSVTQTAATSGAISAMVVTSAASTGQTASTEVNAANFNFSATRTWATGGITTQREFLIQAPTYAFAGASTITTAATFAITGAPIAGTNATLTNTYALWVQSGESYFGGSINSNSAVSVGNITCTNFAANQYVRAATYFGSSNTGTALLGVSNYVTMYRVGGTLENIGSMILQTDIGQSTAGIYLYTGTSPTRKFGVTALGNVVVGTAAISTTATDGFFYIDTTAGVPTGVPTSNTGAAAMVYDTTDNVMFTYNGGWQALLTGTYSSGVGFTLTGTTPLTLTQTAASSGTASAFVVTTGASTGQTASTEVNGIIYNLSATRTWAAGAITTQREFLIQAPTYAFAGASTIGTAATLAITGAPIAGSNATIVSALALLVQAGNVSFGGALAVTGGTTLTSVTTNGILSAADGIVCRNTINANGTTPLQVISSGASSGSAATMTVATGTSTGLTASTEVVSVNFNLSSSRTWATGAITTQREFLIQAPTYAFAGASTITKAATFAITGAPIAGTNATLTSSYALWVQAGLAEFDGSVIIADPTDTTKKLAFNLSGQTTGTTITITSLASGSHNFTIPITSNDTFAFLAVSQTFQGTNTYSGQIRANNALGISYGGSATTSSNATGFASIYRVNGTLENIGSLILQSDSGQSTAGVFVYTGTSPTRKFGVTALGNVVVGTAALSLSATDGFFYIDTCAGVPTGVPTSQTGAAAMVYDTTDNVFFTYSGGWKALLTGTYAAATGFTVSAATLFSGSLFAGGGFADSSISSSSWSAAGSSTIGANIWHVINTNTGTIASYTLTMPAAPNQGQKVRIATAGIVTAMTISANAGQTINGAFTASVFSANTSVEFIYSGTTWYRLL